MRHKLQYLFIRIGTFPLGYCPYSVLHVLGKVIGRIAYFFMRDYRKRSLSNLALAEALHLTPEEIKRIAKESFENLAINMLEYAKWDRETDFSQVIQCENPEIANQLHQEGKGIIFFCAHLSNWEALFLDGTIRMRGIAIGKPIKNRYLYRWIVSIREKNSGRIIAPRHALKEGLRALRKGTFLGIVGDQGMPDSGYSFPFLGRRAWTTTAPALLAYKTHSPIIVASTHRVKGGYRIRYSDPIWPDLTKPLETETPRMMDASLRVLEKSIHAFPGEWLWQHNRWKQQTPERVYKRFRKDCIGIILPDDPEKLQALIPDLQTFREIYPLDFLFVFVPNFWQKPLPINVDETIVYRAKKDLLINDYRIKLIFNFSKYNVTLHYLRLSVYEVLNLKKIKSLAVRSLRYNPECSLSDQLKLALCRPDLSSQPKDISAPKFTEKTHE